MSYYLPGLCIPSTSCYSFKSRLGFEGVAELSAPEKGIRYHNLITAFFLNLFCSNKIVKIKDVRGKIYHLNRGSLSNKLVKYHPHLKGYSPKEIRHVTEAAMQRWLDDVLKAKSPANIVEMSTIKNELRSKMDEKRLCDRLRWNSLAYRGLAEEIEILKKKLNELEHIKT